MKFSLFTTLSSPAGLCTEEMFFLHANDSRTEDLIKRFRAGEEAAKRQLPAVCWHASFPNGKRKASEAQPSGLYMLDIDHYVGDVFQLGMKISECATELGIYVIHVTPSGHGLRVVAKALKCNALSTIADNQRWLAVRLGVPYDEVTYDLARLSFIPQASDIILFNEKIFTDEPEIEIYAGRAAAPAAITTGDIERTSEKTQAGYGGFTFAQITDKYFELHGGRPQEGERNTKLYALARDLRYLCDFNAHTLAKALPSCGLPQSEIETIAKSAIESTRASAMPQSIERVLSSLAEDKTETFDEVDFNIPLPPVIKNFVSRAPADFKTPTIMACLPVLGTVFTRLRSRYLDKVEHSPSLMAIVEAPQASGKSFTRNIVSLLLADIAQADAAARLEEVAYREQLKAARNAKTQPQDPRAVVRILPPSVSIAKLLQRMDYAHGLHLFSFTEELDTVIKSNSAGAWSQKTDLYRNAFDNSIYGQDYMSENTYSANLPIYYNMLVCGTPNSVSRFFKNTEDGLVSRFIFVELKNQFGAKMPVFVPLSAKEKAAILTKIRKCVSEIEDSSTIALPAVNRALDKWLEEQRVRAVREYSIPRDTFRRRAAVMGFRAGMIAAVLNRGLKDAEKNTTLFALRVADYVLNEQIKRFGKNLLTVENEPSRRVNMLNALENVFTRNDLIVQIRRFGLKTPERNVLYVWKKNGLIEKIDDVTYKKTVK